MGDLIFNPTGAPGDADWRVLYIACGDGGSGEQRNPEMRSNPQRLDTLVGKILRIIPDLNEKEIFEHGQRKRPLPDSQRQSVRGESPACAARSGRTGCAIPRG